MSNSSRRFQIIDDQTSTSTFISLSESNFDNQRQVFRFKFNQQRFNNIDRFKRNQTTYQINVKKKNKKQSKNEKSSKLYHNENEKSENQNN